MLRHIQLSALAAGVFAGYLIPVLIAVFLFMPLNTAVEQRDVEFARTLFASIVVVNMAGSVAGGYVAAAVAKHQPLVHGLFSAVIGIALVSPLGRLSVLWAVCYLAGGVSGAWLKKHREPQRGA